MKTITLLPATLLVLLCGLSAQASDQASNHVHVHIDCKANASGECPPPPAPPAPPAPPTPPTPPAMPAPPAPPPSPPVPKIPAVPAEAHAACASKAPGSALTWELRKGETMSGVCERHDGRMRFALRSYDLDD
jgi:hypothetical protein